MVTSLLQPHDRRRNVDARNSSELLFGRNAYDFDTVFPAQRGHAVSDKAVGIVGDDDTLYRLSFNAFKHLFCTDHFFGFRNGL